MTESAISKQTGETPTHAVIWLHGLGADGNDFVPVVPALGIPEDLVVRFVFPHAPIRPITINGGMPMRGWYDIKTLEFIREEDGIGLEQSGELVESLIQQQLDSGIPLDNMILAGFSQGGALALYHALRRQQPIAGIIALSCYLPFHQQIDELPQEAKSTPIFMAHGTEDEIIPIAKGELSHQTLQTHGYDVRWKAYPMAHTVSIEEIEDIGQFIRSTFSQ